VVQDDQVGGVSSQKASFFKKRTGAAFSKRNDMEIPTKTLQGESYGGRGIYRQGKRSGKKMGFR